MICISIIFFCALPSLVHQLLPLMGKLNHAVLWHSPMQCEIEKGVMRVKMCSCIVITMPLHGIKPKESHLTGKGTCASWGYWYGMILFFPPFWVALLALALNVNSKVQLRLEHRAWLFLCISRTYFPVVLNIIHLSLVLGKFLPCIVPFTLTVKQLWLNLVNSTCLVSDLFTFIAILFSPHFNLIFFVFCY